MRALRMAGLLAIAFVNCTASAHAECPPWRPCGPGNTWGGNRCVPQGFYGADFRPACQCHDDCLKTCASRYDCDQQFLCNMYDACECSCNPEKCRRKARCYYRMARLAHMFSH